MFRFRPAIFVFTILMIAMAGSAYAAGDRAGRGDMGNGRRGDLPLDRGQMPMRADPLLAPPAMSDDEVARQAQREFGGRVLSVHRQPDGSYRVRVLKNGEVRTHNVIPGNGSR